MLRFLRSLIFWTAKNHGVINSASPQKSPEAVPASDPPRPSGGPSARQRSSVKNSREQRDLMIAQLRLHEGERLFPYKCTAGRLTIGVGRNLDDRGITAEESAYLLGHDIDDFWERLETGSSGDRARLCAPAVLPTRRSTWAWAACWVSSKPWPLFVAGNRTAASMMLQSRWATQVGERAKRLSRMMWSGETPVELQ